MKKNDKQSINSQITAEETVTITRCEVTWNSGNLIKDRDTYYKEQISNQNFIIKKTEPFSEDGVTITRNNVSWNTGYRIKKNSQITEEKWEHSCIVIVPENLDPGKCGLIAVNNGANSPNEPITDNYSVEVLKNIARHNGIIIVLVNNVPNQPVINSHGEIFYEDNLVSMDIQRYLNGYEKNNPLIYFKMAGVVVLTDKLARKQYPAVKTYAITACSKQVIGACLATQIYPPLQTAPLLNVAMDPRAMPVLGDFLVEESTRTKGGAESLGPILGPYLEVAKHHRRPILNELLSQPLSSEWIHIIMGNRDTTFHKSKVQNVLKDRKNSRGILTYEELQASHKEIKGLIKNQLVHFVSIMNHQPGFPSSLSQFNGQEISLENLENTLSATEITTANDMAASMSQSIVALEDLAEGTSDDQKVVAGSKFFPDLQTSLLKHHH